MRGDKGERTSERGRRREEERERAEGAGVRTFL